MFASFDPGQDERIRERERVSLASYHVKRNVLIVAPQFGIIFWIAISLLPTSFSPYDSVLSFVICIATVLLGTILIAVVSYDVFQRIAAKRELANTLTVLSELEREQLRMEVQSNVGLRLGFPFGNEQLAERDLSNWFSLFMFLTT